VVDQLTAGISPEEKKESYGGKDLQKRKVKPGMKE